MAIKNFIWDNQNQRVHWAYDGTSIKACIPMHILLIS